MMKRVNLLEGNILTSLAKLAFPIMGMSLIQMAYNLTDMIWIGKLGAGAVASVGTGGLILWFCMGIHMISQLGGQVLVAQNLGAGNPQKAGAFAHAAIFISLSLTIILGLVFSTSTTPIVSFFKLNDPNVVANAEIYIRITGSFIMFQLLSKLFTTLITTTGNSKTPFLATSLGLIFNMILDPILIFGYCGFPELGVKGAAIATVCAQIIVFSSLLLYISRDSHLFCHINFKSIPDFKLCKQIIKLSFPVTIQSTLFPLFSMYISRLVAGFGDNAVAVQRVGSQIESISWMTSEGFAVALNSFVAQNRGAGNLKRAKEGYFTSFKLLSAWGLLSSAILIFAARPIFSVFLQEETVLQMGQEYLIILGISQLFMCWEIISNNAMNAFGKTTLPSTISIIFTGIRIPLAILLSATALGLCGIWWSITISSIIKGILLLTTICIYMKKTIK
ncbi:MAG: MATE family efflux transporter [Lachnospiraceae bacterium]